MDGSKRGRRAEPMGAPANGGGLLAAGHEMWIGLRLVLSPAAASVLAVHPALQPGRDGAEVSAEDLDVRVFDTAERDLAGKGLRLSLCRAAGGWTQRLEGATASAPLVRRPIWQWALPGEAAEPRPDPTLLDETPAAGLSPTRLVGRLRLVRRVRRLVLEEGAVVTAVLLDGHAEGPGGAGPWHEIELRPGEGPVLPLFRLATALNGAAPLRLAAVPAVLPGEAAPEVALPGLPPDARAPAGDGFRGAVEAGLGELLANVEAAASGRVEGVHRMRVALRRLRAVLVAFEPLLERRAVAEYQDELRRLGRVLGEARDWDVFCCETLPTVFGPVPGGPMAAAAAARQATAHAKLRLELARPALTDLALSFAAWAAQPGRRAAGRAAEVSLDAPLRRVVPALLDRVEATVFKRGRRIGEQGEAELHRLRKAMKKLRYGLETVSACFGEKAVKRYGRACRKLQESLGRANDGAVALELAEQLAEAAGPALEGEMRALRHWSGKVRRKAAKGVPAAWDRFRGAEAPWK